MKKTAMLRVWAWVLALLLCGAAVAGVCGALGENEAQSALIETPDQMPEVSEADSEQVLLEIPVENLEDAAQGEGTDSSGTGEEAQTEAQAQQEGEDEVRVEADVYLGVGERYALSGFKGRFSSDAPEVARVSAKKGVVTAVSVGTAIITATDKGGAEVRWRVQVLKAPGKVRLSAKKMTLGVGESAALQASLPDGTAGAIRFSSNKKSVVSVDASGRLKAKKKGTAVITARAYNGKKAKCTVKVFKAPSRVKLSAGELLLCENEKAALKAKLPKGSTSAITWSSGDESVARVDPSGEVRGVGAGETTVTARAFNGKEASCRVTVLGGSAPTTIALASDEVSMEQGTQYYLSAAVGGGENTVFSYSTSDGAVATVDSQGLITAVKKGTAVITVTTHNGLSAKAKVQVKHTVSPRQMVKNLRASKALGGKREAIANVIGLLIDNGFEPAFAAGVGANIYAEGTYGLFESSRYIANPHSRPRYFCYLDGGEHYAYVGGEYVVDTVYLSEEELASYEGEAEARLRYGEENFYLDNYSRQYVQNVDLAALESFVEALAQGEWEGKFGLGVVQWTGVRTQRLLAFYRRQAGTSDRLTAAQVVQAENEMILSELKGGYSGVYSAWKSANKEARDTEDAARSAGELVCTRYEIPADRYSKAVTRGHKAEQIYRIMTD